MMSSSRSIAAAGRGAQALLHPQLWPAFATFRACYASSATEWLEGFTNYERQGVPPAAGTDTADGFDLGRMRRLLACLGGPQAAWPAVHVAGTKGKGSTVAMLAGVLRESGYRVGTYTSPHVVSLHERICIDDAPIPSEALDALVARHAPAVEAAQREAGGALSHFEVLTALAFKHFQEEAVEVAVIEAGLGGARDATNVLPAEGLRVAVVTAVGMDHADALGGTLERIAAAKAGILQAGRPAVLARQPEAAAAAVLLAHAAQLGCLLTRAEEEAVPQPGPVEWAPAGGALGLRQRGALALRGAAADALGGAGPLELSLHLLGAHQLDNAATAAAAAAALRGRGFERVTAASVVRGLDGAALPGRLQVCRLAAEASSNSGGDGIDAAAEQEEEAPLVVLDGAHTEASAAALADTLLAAFPDAAFAVVLAMAGDKPHLEVCAQLRRLSPLVVAFTEVAVGGGRARAAPPGALAAAWQRSAGGAGRRAGGGRTRELVQASLGAAVAKARMELRAAGGRRGVVVVTGSLHAAGAALRTLDLSPLP